MYKVNDLLVYKKDVCLVEEIKYKYLRDTDYYILSPINDKSLKIQVPVTSSAIRSLITKERIDKIITNIPNIEVIKSDTKKLENDYKQLMQSGTHEDLIKIINSYCYFNIFIIFINLYLSLQSRFLLLFQSYFHYCFHNIFHL